MANYNIFLSHTRFNILLMVKLTIAHDVCCHLSGFTTDGKFNSLRTAGNSRPISVLELIKNSRNEARRMNPNTIARFFQLDRQGRCY